MYLLYLGTLVRIIRLDNFYDPIHGLIQVVHCSLITINQEENLYQRFANCAHFLRSFPEGVGVHQFNNGSPIMSCVKCTIMPLIIDKHLLQLKLTLEQRLKRNEVAGKTCDCRTQQILVSCAFPHEAKNKCMVIYELGDGPSSINELLGEGYFSHILKHQINAMGTHGIQNTMGCLSISNLLTTNN